MLAHIITIALITYAVAYMVAETNGIFDVFLRLRVLFGVEIVPVLDNDGNVIDAIIEITSKSAEFITCFWCVGFWVSLAVTNLYVVFISSDLSDSGAIHVWLAALGLAGFMRGVSWQDR